MGRVPVLKPLEVIRLLEGHGFDNLPHGLNINGVPTGIGWLARVLRTRLRLPHLRPQAGYVEPRPENAQASDSKDVYEIASCQGSQIGSQISDNDSHQLAKVVASWSRLKPELKQAVLAIVASVESGGAA